MGGPSSCVPNARTLCIDGRFADRRFRLGLHYASAAGGGISGDARTLPVVTPGSKGGLFYFFEARNPEMPVKVLDGCAENDHFWVFYSAATTLGFELTVEDTQTDRVRTYTNPDSRNAATVSDTAAFPCD